MASAGLAESRMDEGQGARATRVHVARQDATTDHVCVVNSDCETRHQAENKDCVRLDSQTRPEYHHM